MRIGPLPIRHAFADARRTQPPQGAVRRGARCLEFEHARCIHRRCSSRSRSCLVLASAASVSIGAASSRAGAARAGGSPPTPCFAAALALAGRHRRDLPSARRSPPCSPCSGRSSRSAASAASTARGGTRISEWSDRIVLMRRGARSTVGAWVEPIELGELCAGPRRSASLCPDAVRRRAPSRASRTSRPARPCARLRLGPGRRRDRRRRAWLAVVLARISSPARSRSPTPPSARCSSTAVIALLMTQLSLVMNHERQASPICSRRSASSATWSTSTRLTRLPNRRHFHELAERAVEAARDAATLIVFDVDRHAARSTSCSAIRPATRRCARSAPRCARRCAGATSPAASAATSSRSSCRARASPIRRSSSRASSPRLDDRQVAPRIARVMLNVGSGADRSRTRRSARRCAAPRRRWSPSATKRAAASPRRRRRQAGSSPTIDPGRRRGADAVGADEPDPGRRSDPAGADGRRARGAHAFAAPRWSPRRRRQWQRRMPDLPLVTLVTAALAVTLAYTVFGLTGFGARRSSAFPCSPTSCRSASRCR